MDFRLFEKCARFITELTEIEDFVYIPSLSDDQKVKLYALFQQATNGPCKLPRPWFFDSVGKSKYKAWISLGEMPQSLAAQIYVELVLEYLMSLQSKIISMSDSVDGIPEVYILLSRIEELKTECADFWPERFSHLQNPEQVDNNDSEIFARQDCNDFIQENDSYFTSPSVISDERNIPLPTRISQIINGISVDGSEISVGDYDEDPLHVKEPRMDGFSPTFETNGNLEDRVRILEDTNEKLSSLLKDFFLWKEKVNYCIFFSAGVVAIFLALKCYSISQKQYT